MDNDSIMKNQPPKKPGKERIISFRALPEEVENWTEMAEADGRSLSNWIRLKVNKSLEDNSQTEPKNESEEPLKAEENDQPNPTHPKNRES